MTMTVYSKITVAFHIVVVALLFSLTNAWNIQRQPLVLPRRSPFTFTLHASRSPRDASRRVTTSSSSSAASSSSFPLVSSSSSWDLLSTTMSGNDSLKTRPAAGGLSGGARRRRSPTSLSSTIPHDAPMVESLHEMAYEQQQQHETHPTQGLAAWADQMLSTYWGPRGLLIVLAAVYATNFPLGALMNDRLPASAATASRMFVAGLALAPFIPRLRADLRLPAVSCGFFTAMGYVTQSLALRDVDPARVSFLGSVTVLWCPLLECLIDQKPMGWKEAPQTWLAALLCIAGIGVLELDGESCASLSVTWGDGLALLQAVGFGTGVFWTSRMLRKDSSQALPVTAVLIATTAFLSALWCLADGWMNGAAHPDWFQSTLAGMAMEESLRPVLLAVLWTGLVSTSLNFFVELTALGHVPPSEASVLLASEPLWAALFAAAFYQSRLSTSDGAGGLLIVAACLVNALVSPDLFRPKTTTTITTTTTALSAVTGHDVHAKDADDLVVDVDQIN